MRAGEFVPFLNREHYREHWQWTLKNKYELQGCGYQGRASSAEGKVQARCRDWKVQCVFRKEWDFQLNEVQR